MIRRTLAAILFALLPFQAAAAPRTNTVLYYTAAGGMNDSNNPLNFPAGDVSEARNITFDITGAWATRLGTAKHNSSAISGTPTITGLFEWVQSSGTRTFLAATSDGKIFEDVSGTWTSRKTGLTTGENQWDFANWKGTTVIGCNAQDQAQTSTDATTWSDLSTPPSGVTTCKLWEVHRGRNWMVPKNSNTVYYSPVDSTDFTAAGNGSIVIGDPTEGFVTGLHSYLGTLIVFKERAIHLISGATADTFAAAPLVVGLGTLSDRTIATVSSATGTDVLFASDRGIHSLKATDAFGDFSAIFISQKITKTWNGLNKSRLNKMAAVFNPTRSLYIISVTTSGQTANDQLFVFDAINLSWSVHTGVSAFSLANRTTSTGVQEIYHGDFAGFVYEHGKTAYTNAGTAYTSLVRTGPLHFDRPDLRKTLQSITLFYEPKGAVTMNVGYTADSNLVETRTFSMAGSGAVIGTFVIGTDVLSDARPVSTVRLDLKRSARLFQFSFYVTASGGSFRLFGYAVEFSVDGP